jgi:hypothetical protein
LTRKPLDHPLRALEINRRFERLFWSCALTVWSVVESLVGSLRYRAPVQGATFVTAVDITEETKALRDDFDLFVGIDLAAQKHQACIVNRSGKVVGELAFEHSGAGLTAFIRSLDKLTGAMVDRVAIAAATPKGLIVECVLERGYSAFSINPKQVDRFRDLHTLAGA